MNNPNPFVPQGSLQEQQNQRRTNLKLGVLGVLTVSVVCLTVMLIQGCKQKAPTDDNGSTASVDTNTIPVPDTNVPPLDVSNQAPALAGSNTVSMPTPALPVAQTPVPMPPMTTPMPPAAPEVAAGGGEYVVEKGDSLAKIAKKNGVSLKALEAANEGVKPSKLKIGQKLVIPAGGKSVSEAPAASGASAGTETEGKTYTVKSGDTLTKIAKTHHVKVKELEAANGLTSTKIKVGEKLKIPVKGEVPAAPAPVSAPMETPAAPPVPSVMPAPAPATPSLPTAPAQH